MLRKLSEQMTDCYRRADECRQKAELAENPADKKFYETQYERWLGLARSYEFVERLQYFINANDFRTKK